MQTERDTFKDGQFLMDPNLKPHHRHIPSTFTVYTPDVPYNYEALYRGPIVARTATHYLQHITDHRLVAHPRSHLDVSLLVDRNNPIDINYKANGQIAVTDTSPHARHPTTIPNVTKTLPKTVTMVRAHDFPPPVKTISDQRRPTPFEDYSALLANFTDFSEVQRAAAQALNKQGVEVFPVELGSGLFPGQIVAETPNYYVQQLGSKLLYAHPKERLKNAITEPLELGSHYTIRYSMGKAHVQESIPRNTNGHSYINSGPHQNTNHRER